MKKILTLLTIATIAVSLIGCCTNEVVSKPSDISLEKAMESIGKGFAAMKTAEGNSRTGLYPDTAQVTFNISAGSSKSGGLNVDLSASAGPQIPVSGTVGGSISNNSTAQRANQITITFKNILNLSPTNTLMSKPADVQAMLDIIKNSSNLTVLEIQAPANK